MLTLISLLSFLLPTQLGFHLNNLSTYVYGFKIDYLTPTLYLTDIIVVLIISLGIAKIKFKKKHLLYATIYIGFIALNILVSSYRIASFYKWLKVTEMLLLAVVIINTKKFNIFKHFVMPLSLSVFVASLLGILQYFNKGSIGGIFYWFGERSFLFSSPNIAPYPYSFFSHPNSFAGFLLVFLIYLIKFKKNFNLKYYWLLVFFIIINLILTNSLNVYLTVIFLLLIKYRKNMLPAFLLIDFGDRFITHRIELIKASLQLIKNNFWLGVGLNNFIPNLVKVSNNYLNSWELQPVHNIFLLIFTEVGFVGFVFITILFFSLLDFGYYPLSAILITGLSDHYWLTLQQNILLLTFVLALSKPGQK